jgi:hypothetical protein
MPSSGSGDFCMPVLLTRDEALSARLKSARASTEFLTRNWADLQANHTNEFVAVDDGRLLGSGKTPEDAFRIARSNGASKETTQIAFVPAKGTSLYY